MVQRHLAKELHQASNRLRRRIDRISLAHGLTGPQGMVLAFLSWHSQPVVQRDVEQEFDVRRSTVSCLLTQLEKDGFIRRESVEGDARLRRLVVTQRGLEAHRAGKGAKYTRGRGPLELVHIEERPDKSAALRREHEIKKMRREQKERLISKN